VNVAFKGNLVELIKGCSETVKFLARIEEMSFVDEKPAESVGATVAGTEIYLLMDSAVDLEKEKERLAKEKANLENYIAVQEKKLGNADFVDHAPEAVVAGERKKLEEAKEKLAKIVEQQSSLT
jgi:valyl-tRNA synthetase